ncbi:MAG: TetR/AcrR family transcriptional regulator [Alphaproteobacteria bacterium]|nr:TetR/AcrR family transcriptional regulator [Alphaproteobacteria bacterium]
MIDRPGTTDNRLDDQGSERPLGRGDWIDTALAILVSDGIDAVKITRLADTMGVTRGSFYWHFENRADLLDALIGRWEAKNTSAVVAAVETAADLTEGILALFDAWMDVGRFDPGLDSAMRDWARRSSRVRATVDDADKRRVDVIAALFERADYDPAESIIRARVIYFSQVGYYALGIEETLGQRVAHIETFYLTFTGRQMDRDLAQAYRRRHGIGPGREQRGSQTRKTAPRRRRG